MNIAIHIESVIHCIPAALQVLHTQLGAQEKVLIIMLARILSIAFVAKVEADTKYRIQIKIPMNI